MSNTTNKLKSSTIADRPRRFALRPFSRNGWTLRSVILIVALTTAAASLGGAGGYWISRRGESATGTTLAASPGDDGEQWYTCGMHPNVLQKGPGDCPICQMKLTPRKSDDDPADAGSSNGPTERRVLYWRAPMDPNYVTDQPGKSPMGMDLVPVYADESESSSAHTIRIDPVTIQNMGIRTAGLQRGPLVKTIRTIGRVDYDEQTVSNIDTKFDGWIEKLFVDETGQFVEKGQPLFEVYSPQLYSAQEEYRAAIRNLPRMEGSTFAPAVEESRRLVEAARIKLEYLDVSDAQIDRLSQGNEITKTLTIHSPSRGIVTEKMAIEGMYVKPSMRLYTIADLSRVWVYVDIYEYQLPWIHVGQDATMTLPYVPGAEFFGQVVYIYPYLEKQTRVIKVRLEFDNSQLELKPGMYANIILKAELSRDALLILREAYIDSGIRKVAFVDIGGGKFQPREIQVGVEAEDGMVEVLHGLDQGEVVVTSGQFMLDAESKLKEAVAKMMEAERALTTRRAPKSSDVASHSGDHDPTAAGEALSNVDIPANALFACPMAQHPDEADPESRGPYYSDSPGSCPLCGMALKPLEELDWVQVRLAAKGADVAYTCPDHQHVFSIASGECPRCGTRLSPFRVTYSCPDPVHAGVISTVAGNCPQCGRGLAPLRSIWLDEAMAEANVPPNPGLADAAPFRCPVHPLVHSDNPGACTICGLPLESDEPAVEKLAAIPPGARYTCPMKECGVFSESEGSCPECGMKLKALEQVAWARDLLAAVGPPQSGKMFICPMHPEQVKAARAGTCTICGMQLVAADAHQLPQAASARITAQMNYITEHYLELVRLLAADQSKDLALHALGLASASETLANYVRESDAAVDSKAIDAVNALHKAALKMTGTNIQSDRVTLVELSAAMNTLIENVRPDQRRWPTLYIYHCPMSKGDWIQAAEEKANPYYGFKMLKCGELREKR